MVVRLVASDLDGTLFDADHVPAPRTVAAVNALVDAGVVVTAATGRSWFGGAERATMTGARLDWFIGSNGGHRLNLRDDTLEERLVFDEAEIGDLIGHLDESVGELAWGFEHDRGFWFSELFLQRYPEAVDGGPRRSTVSEPRYDDIGKIFVSHADVLTNDLVGLLEPFTPPSVVVTTSGINFVELTPEGADKGSAVSRLADRLGIGAEEVVAFGDNHNDLTMLAWAGRGVAMGNAVEEAKAVADEVTATNLDHGVAVVLEQILADQT